MNRFPFKKKHSKDSHPKDRSSYAPWNKDPIEKPKQAQRPMSTVSLNRDSPAVTSYLTQQLHEPFHPPPSRPAPPRPNHRDSLSASPQRLGADDVPPSPPSLAPPPAAAATSPTSPDSLSPLTPPSPFITRAPSTSPSTSPSPSPSPSPSSEQCFLNNSPTDEKKRKTIRDRVAMFDAINRHTLPNTPERRGVKPPSLVLPPRSSDSSTQATRKKSARARTDNQGWTAARHNERSHSIAGLFGRKAPRTNTPPRANVTLSRAAAFNRSGCASSFLIRLTSTEQERKTMTEWLAEQTANPDLRSRLIFLMTLEHRNKIRQQVRELAKGAAHHSARARVHQVLNKRHLARAISFHNKQPSAQEVSSLTLEEAVSVLVQSRLQSTLPPLYKSAQSHIIHECFPLSQEVIEWRHFDQEGELLGWPTTVSLFRVESFGEFFLVEVLPLLDAANFAFYLRKAALYEKTQCPWLAEEWSDDEVMRGPHCMADAEEIDSMVDSDQDTDMSGISPASPSVSLLKGVKRMLIAASVHQGVLERVAEMNISVKML